MTSEKRKSHPPRRVRLSTRKSELRQSATGDEDRVQQERFRVLIEEVADGFYEVDLKGNFTFFNDAMCRIFGRSRAEILGRNYREFMDEENARIAFEAFNKIYRSGKGVTDISWEIRDKKGQKRFLEISANLIVDNEGQKAGFRGIARDVTEKVLAQQALRESEQCALELSKASRRAEQRFRAFLEFLPEPIFVFNLDSTVSYLNPAFEKVFGWTLEEMRGKIIPFVPEGFKQQTREGIKTLLRDKVIHGFETRRLTKDGRLLDIVIDGALFYDEDGQPAGQVLTLRDVTEEKRNTRINQALFRIARAMHRYRGLDERLELITREVQDLLGVEGAMVILLDEKNREFFFREAVFDDSETGKKFKEVRFPVDKGIAGLVYRTGQPQIVEDTYRSPHFFRRVDQQVRYRTRNMLDVPLTIQGRMIGVLCAVNKKEGRFGPADVELLTTIANLVALPIENASIYEELQRSYREVQSLNRAKDRVIHHLSHELKTPISILAASLSLLKKRLKGLEDRGWDEILQRAERNLNRLLDMQYEIEDLLRKKDYRIHALLTMLLEACREELEVLVSEHLGEQQIIERIRAKVDALFGPRDAKPEAISLDRFVADKVRHLRPGFAHRRCRLETRIEKSPPVWIPPTVLEKIVEGLIRNAVENTPDSGMVTVSVRPLDAGTVFEVADTGVGISAENQRLIFENYFTAYEPMQYSTRKPYDFQAGGKGFDLLRMKIFSERYGFQLQMSSRRCRFLATAKASCPGDIAQCSHCSGINDCRDSGGTTVTVTFPAADRTAGEQTS